MQKQKNQVRQYLSESFQHQPNLPNMFAQMQPRLCAPQTNSAPDQINNNYLLNVQTGNGLNNQCLHPHSHPIYCGTRPSPSPDAPSMSPALSSGATSASEVCFKFYYVRYYFVINAVV